MKKIKFTCSSCEAKLRVPTHLAGVSAPCPKCGATITAPHELDNVVDEAPRSTSSSRSATIPRTTSQEKYSSTQQRTVSDSVLTTPPIQEQQPVPPNRDEPPVSRGPAPAAEERQPVLPELDLPQEMNESPVAPSQLAPGLPVPEHAAVSEQVSSDPEPELIVTEQRIIPPTPRSIQPPEVPPVVETNLPVETCEEPAIAEETHVPVPKTQPIRINPRPDNLLPPRSEDEAGPQELPRLDVNLAATSNEPQAAAPSLGETPPTRVQLPQVGETREAFSPEDFFAPTQTPAEVAPPAQAPAEVAPPSSSLLDELPEAKPELSEELVYDSTPSEEELAFDEQAHSEIAEPHPPVEAEAVETAVAEWSRQVRPETETVDPPREELVGLDDTFGTEPIPHSSVADEMPVEDPGLMPESTDFPFDDSSPTPADETAHPPQEDYPGDENALHEGSFEILLSKQNEPEEAAPLASAPNQSQVVSPDFPFQSPVQEVPRPAAETETELEPRTDADVLDEMFGTPSVRSKGVKKSTIVILSVIGAVTIIATICMVLIIDALGGVNPYPELAEKTVPPPYESIEEESNTQSNQENPSTYQEPNLDDAPAIIDPVARRRVEPNHSGVPAVESSGPVLNDSAAPERIEPSPQNSNAGNNTVKLISENTNSTSGNPASIGREDPALTFDERLEQTMNSLGTTDAASPSESGNGLNLSDSGTGIGGTKSAVPGAAAGALAASQNSGETAQNYNPPAAFPAPDGTETSPLGKTHDLLDAFLRAPNWESQIPYIFEGESLRPAIEQYYKKWPFTKFDRFSLQLFQMEQDTEIGGPYWVYLVSTSDTDQGYPVIVRIEDGNLKVDWEIYSEFQDQHFAQFLKGSIASPRTFRLVIERVSDYYGPDRIEFSELEDHLVYQINPPYGDLGEFSEYAFVKRDSELAKQLDEVVGLSDEPLAVIISLEQKKFSHGVTHEVITNYVTEGWFR